MTYETLLVEQRGAVTLITLNRPQALNALNSQVLADLIVALGAFDADPSQGCAVLTGSEKAFAAGADIKEMATQSFADMYGSNFFAGYDRVTATRKPVIAAVAGYALGGGCELAMMCDFIIAADNAKFGQPEIKLAVTPGMGGSQRMARAIGKAKTMDMCLTGRMMDATEAEQSGLVARVVPLADLVDEAVKAAETIAGMAPLATLAVKEMVNAAFETTLQQGVVFERRLFHGLFGSEDQSEGAAASPQADALRLSVQDAAMAYRAALAEAAQRGEAQRGCPPPPGQAQLSLGDLIGDFQAFPDTHRDMPVATAFALVMTLRYPCETARK